MTKWPSGLCVLLLWLATPACQRAPYHYQPLSPTEPATASSESSAQLLFLSFNMTTGPDGKHQLEPISLKSVPGQASPLAEEDVSGPSYLLLTQLDAQQQPCGPARRVPHPLVQDVESAAANGELRHQTSVQAQAEFFVRLARQPHARAVRLAEVGPAAPKPISIVLPLPN